MFPSALSSILVACAKSRLCHFLALGGVLALAAPRDPDEARAATIVVEAGRINERLRAEEARRGRRLEAAEREGITREVIDEEVLAREATRAGLGEGDPIVRTRLAERMRAALAQALPAPRASEREIADAVDREIARAPERTRVALWFVPKERADAAREAESIATAIRAEGPDRARGRGERPPIPDNAFWTETELARLAGPVVAHAAFATAVGNPSEALPSAWGYYVLVPLERRPASADDVRADVERGLALAKQREDLDKLVARARANYTIDVRGTVN